MAGRFVKFECWFFYSSVDQDVEADSVGKDVQRDQPDRNVMQELSLVKVKETCHEINI